MEDKNIKMSLTRRNITNNNDSLCDHHIQYILKSGLLLDEDMDCILLHYSSDEENRDEKGLTLFQKFLGALSVTTTIFIVQKKCPFLYTTISASPFVILAFKHLKEVLRKKNHKHNMEVMVETVHNISKLNRMIFEYFKLRRNNFSPTTVSIINPYTKGMKQLVETIFDEEVNLLYTYRILIREFGTYVPSLKTDYAYLENLEFEDFCSSNVTCINDCIVYLQKLCDIYVLVSSNCLTCLALTLCPSLWVKYDFNVNDILKMIVPKMKKVSLSCYNKIYKKFDDLKYHYLNKSQVKRQFKKPKPSAATKLQIGTYNTMVHTTEILEKSQIIYKKLQEVDLQSLSEREKLGKCISELRGHVFDYYESLDVLYKLYQVNINASRPALPFNQSEVTKEEGKNVDVVIKDASLNPSEPSDDEEYELYIGANETSSEGASFGYYEEQESRKFASLLSQELKHKLKTHAQFIAARKKRGIIDEEPESSEAEIEEAVLKQDSLSDVNDVNPPQEFVNPRGIVAPPPPPPLPPIDLGPYGDNIGSLYTVDDFLESIRAASKNRNNVEEVFGSSPDDV